MHRSALITALLVSSLWALACSKSEDEAPTQTQTSKPPSPATEKPVAPAKEFLLEGEPVQAVELKKGHRYRASVKVPLMPGRSIDEVEKRGGIEHLEAGTVFLVREISPNDSGAPWYKVGTDTTWGWLNSIALLKGKVAEATDATSPR